MKKVLLLTIATGALLNLTLTAHASPKSMEQKRVHIAAMCQDKSTRTMMIRELMRTADGKMEMARMLKADAEFRSLYETMAVNPG